MRWIFLLLLVLNLFYYIWHQQQAPVRLTEVPAVSSYRQAEQRIGLLSEAKPEQVQRARTETEAGNEVCLFLGSYPRREAADALAQQLLARDIAASVQSDSIVVGADYWVFLPPLASRQAAIRQLRELHSRNLDSYVITVGELENGVSLGIFSEEMPALTLAARVSDLGYAPEIQTLARTHQRYVVRVSAVSRAQLEPALVAQIAQPGLEISEQPCEGLAEPSDLE